MRLLAILRLVLPLTLSFLRDRRRWVVTGRPLVRPEGFHDARATRLLQTITRLGPSFVKIGQMFAGRADLLPEPYAARLEALTDQVPPAPFDAIHRTVEESLGRPLEALFDRFDPVPIAAGSLGQVHRASYRGQDLAVKILRPGVRELVAGDVKAGRFILRQIVRWNSNPHTRGMQNVLEEFAERIGDEMDFRAEAENARAVRKNFAGNRRIRVPRVIDERSSGEVLVLEFVTGIRIDAIRPGQAIGGLVASQIVDRLIETYIQMMLVDGFFHADPHPGNLLVAEDGALVLLDFGVVIRVTKERRTILVNAVFAAVQGRAEGVVDGFYALGMVEPGVERDRILKLVELLLDLARTRTTARDRVELLTGQIMDELANWPVRLPSDLVYFARTAGLIEGVGIRYDPTFNPILDAGPVLFRMRGKLLGALEGTNVLGHLDWPTAIGYFLGKATAIVQQAGNRLATYVSDYWGVTKDPSG